MDGACALRALALYRNAAQLTRRSFDNRGKAGRFWDVGSMDFEIIGDITAIEPIAVRHRIRDRRRLRRLYGKGRWRKLRGIATVRLLDGTIHTAEVYEAHGIGRKEFKLKLPLLD